MMTWTPENNLKITREEKARNKAVDVTKWIKKQQGLDYLPWAIVQDLLEVFNDDLDVGFEENESGEPFHVTDGRGVFLRPYLFSRSSGKRTPASIYPVRDTRRKSDPNVTVDTIGNQMQRAYVKCIAKETGLGWVLFSRYDESLDEAIDHTYSEPAKKAYTTKPLRQQPVTAAPSSNEWTF